MWGTRLTAQPWSILRRGSHEDNAGTKFTHSWRIWLVFLVLCLLSFISAIDATIITTSLPTITHSIAGSNHDSSNDYVWISNTYLFASTAPQPFFGQISNILGRRNPMLVSIALFALGSGVAGGASSVAMLIAGRTVQGLGTGGLYVLSDIIICDMIPPRHRGPYLSAVLANWRWIFWLNLPVSAVGFAVVLLLLRVRYASFGWAEVARRVDWVGNALFIPSMVSLFFGLIMGRTKGYAWSSAKIIVPIVSGVLGWVMFHVHQAAEGKRWGPKERSMPMRLFKHPTSAGGYLIIFFGGVVLQAVSYFLPVYFQGVLGVSPLRAGVYFLPFALAIIPLGGITGFFMSKTGLYIPLRWIGFAFSAIGIGLFSLLHQNSSTGEWVGYQILASAGTAVIFTATLPSTLAPLGEKDVGVATGTYSFGRSLGLVWGVTMASIVFNGQFNAKLKSNTVLDQGLKNFLADGAAYVFVSASAEEGGIRSLPAGSQGELIGIYVHALNVVWYVIVGMACLGFLVTFVEKHVPLRREHQTEFGLVDKEERSSGHAD
ncbi:major facilitator superfamily domain-containing protein [Cladorrhinum sp. PSN332]|nr:major facilitator superfamily domain-containing protein [Cladorrhinum sp. PSN332]